jgi:hypothetical protein
MRHPRILAATAALVLLLLLWAEPAAAQEWAQVLWSKAKSLMVLGVFAFIICQTAAILLFARVLSLEGGVVAALLALIVAVALSVAAAIPVSVVAALMPAFVSQLIISAASFACGGLAVKWLFKASFGLGVLVYVMASTATMIITCVGLIVIL